VRAAVLTTLGAPRFAEFPEPVACDGQAVVEVLAAGLNPVDVAIASGAFRDGPPPLPSIPGHEGIGLLDGRRVYFDKPVSPYGAMAERALIDPASVIVLPDALDHAVAVGLGTSGLAGWVALASRARMLKGEHVLVLGASGAVGQIGVQAARLLGAGRIIAACRSAEGLALSRELGADAQVAITGDADQLTAAFTDAAEGRIDVVVDLLWGAPVVAAIRAATFGARVVHIGQAAGAQAHLSGSVLRSASLTVCGFSVFGIGQDVKREAFARMAAHVSRSELSVLVETMALEDVQAAWSAQQAGPRRKLVLLP
jgi:NADPH:quinone reductase-like Zn-dependent oxidoreductase